MVSTLVLKYFDRPRLGHTITLHCNIYPDICSILIFYKRVRDEFLHYMLCDISFIILYYINRPNFMVRLPLLLKLLSNICIVITCCPVCDVINFEIFRRFLITPFFYVTKMSGQKCKYLKNEKYGCSKKLYF